MDERSGAGAGSTWQTVSGPGVRVWSWALFGAAAVVAIAVWGYRRWWEPSTWARRAAEAAAAADYPRARRLLARVVQRRPDWARSRLKLAQLLDITGQTEAAVDQLYHLPQSLLEREDVLTNLGRMLIDSYRPGEAELYLKRCLHLYPQNVRARQLLLDIYRWQHREEEGRALRAELLDMAQTKTLADRLWILVRSFLEEYSKIEDNENWEHLLRCWNRNANDPAVRIAMARHLILQRDQVRRAAQDLEALLPRSPHSVAALASLIEYYLNIEGESVDRAGQLLQRWPRPYRYYTYWRYQGRVLEMRGDDRGAAAAYRRALADRPDDIPALTRMVLLLGRLAAGRDQALLAERAALTRRLYRAQLALAQASDLVNRIQQWLKQWDQCTQGLAPPPDSGILKQMADFYAQVDRTEQSRLWTRAYEEMQSLTRLVTGAGQPGSQLPSAANQGGAISGGKPGR